MNYLILFFSLIKKRGKAERAEVLLSNCHMKFPNSILKKRHYKARSFQQEIYRSNRSLGRNDTRIPTKPNHEGISHLRVSKYYAFIENAMKIGANQS